jgi:hypothetical protein
MFGANSVNGAGSILEVSSQFAAFTIGAPFAHSRVRDASAVVCRAKMDLLFHG